MAEPTIICPKCKTEIKLTESLAAPLLETSRKEFERRLAEKDEAVGRIEKSLSLREDVLAKKSEALEATLSERLKTETTRIAKEEAKKAKLALESDIQEKDRTVEELQQTLKKREDKLAEAQKGQVDLLKKQRKLEDAKREMELTNQTQLQAAITAAREQALKEADEKIREEAKRLKTNLETELAENNRKTEELEATLKRNNEKLAEAQKGQAELLKKQRELEDGKRELELTIEKRVQESISTAREKAKKEAEDELKLKVMEKEQTISSMQKQIEELKRRAEQGSQQLQGEVQELELESLLRAKFPQDSIEPVPKGEHGGDVLQRVKNSSGQVWGTIIWESKRTKSWSDTWLPKLREDQRTAKAEIAVIVSHALPKDIDPFGQIEEVWVTHPKTAMPVAVLLRQVLLEVSAARIASEGQQTKMEMVYQYLTGPRFRQRIQAIVEAFSSMNEDLDKEKKVITKQWAKREEQIDRVMQSTVGMYGDLQGIAGKSLQEIEGLELRALEAPTKSDE